MERNELQEGWQVLEAAHSADGGLCVFPVGVKSGDADLCIGRDEAGRRHLLIPLDEKVGTPQRFRSSGLSARARSLMHGGKEIIFWDLMCRVPSLNEIFSHLILDVLHDMRSLEPEALRICMQVLDQWRSLFGGGGAETGIERAKGLLGELLILEKLTRHNSAVIKNWSGPSGGIHDFRRGSRALEVKTTTRRYGRYLSISGHLQLEAPAGGDLHLAVVKLEASPDGLLSIPALLESIRSNGVDQKFLQSLLSGLDSDENNEVHRFDLVECLIYRVDDVFPRIVEATFEGNRLPVGVIRISYEIDLSGSMPAHLSDVEADEFMRRFAREG